MKKLLFGFLSLCVFLFVAGHWTNSNSNKKLAEYKLKRSQEALQKVSSKKLSSTSIQKKLASSSVPTDLPKNEAEKLPWEFERDADGRLMKIKGSKLSLNASTPNDAAKEFLDQHFSDFFNISSRGFEVSSIDKIGAVYRITYGQSLDGLRVYPGSIKVLLNSDMDLVYLNADYVFPYLEKTGGKILTDREIGVKAVEAVMHKFKKDKEQNFKSSNIEAIVYNDSGKARLAYKVVVNNTKSKKQFAAILDAKSGAVFEKYSLTRY